MLLTLLHGNQLLVIKHMKKIISFLSFLSLPTLVFAQATSSVDFPDPLKGATLATILPKILMYAMWAGAVILTVLVVWAAYILMFSKGDPAEIKKAKNTLLYGVVGYVILLFAEAIRRIIMSLLGVSY